MSSLFVLGNAGVDLILALPHLVRPGETTVATSATRAPGGKGLNQAVVAARAGASVRFCAAVGVDTEADFVAAALAREPLAGLRLLAKPVPTDQSIVMVAACGENSIVSLCGCADLLTKEDAALFASAATGGDILLLQGNLTADATSAAARASPARIVFNAAPVRWPVAALLPRCAVLVANRGEAASITGQPDPEPAAEMLRAFGCDAAVITLGDDGCVWADANGSGRLAAVRTEAVDTTGAGDTFCGVLAARLAGGAVLGDAIAAGQAAAAVSVTRPGAFAALPSMADLGRRYMASG